MGRREFLSSFGVTLALGRVGTADEQPFRRLVFTGGSPETELGFAIGISEARRMADLLGITWAKAITADVAGGPVVSALPLALDARTMYSVRATAANKQKALQIWQHRNPPRVGVSAVEWHDSLEKFGAQQLNARLRAGGRVPTAEVWAGWMAVKVVAESILRSSPRWRRTALLELSFDGHKGTPLRFDSTDRHLRQPLYIVDPAGRLQGTIESGEELP